MLLSLLAAPSCGGISITSWHHGDLSGNALICTPKGTSPFPAVVYSHGLVVDKHGILGAANRGYDLSGICRALADDGFLAFLPIRRSGLGKLEGHLSEVLDALAAVKARPDVDRNKVSVAGFSRGGLLSLMASVRGVSAQSFVLLAPAPGAGTFRKELGLVHKIGAPMLAMVERSDSPAITKNVDLRENALQAAGKPHKVMRYDGGEGHALFATAGYYWPDLIRFLRDPTED